MSILPSDVHGVLTNLVAGLSSADNSIRAEAEKSLNNDWSKKDTVEMLLVFLAEQSTSGPSEQARAFSAVLFRRIAIKSPSEQASVTARTAGYISDPVKAQIRSILLEGFVGQQSTAVRHKLSDSISEMAKDDASPSGSWPELIPALFQATKNQDPSYRESAFRVFSSAPELIDKSYLNEVLPVFNSGFEDNHDDVRIAACTAFVAFFQELPKKVWPSLSPLLPNLLNSLPRFLQNGQDQALTSVLESLIELVELAPKMFRNMFANIIEFCSMVSKNKELDSSTRMAALELLTTFSEVSPNMCKKEPSYIENLVVQTLAMMTEVSVDDEQAESWNNSDDVDDDDEEIEYDAARQALDRVSLRLGGQVLAPPLFQYLPQMISSSEWRERQAALMALSSAAEGCRDVLITEIPKILDLILPSLTDPHPRVQYSCCNALGQISTDFADTIQRTSGDRILPALVSKLTNDSVPRVQAHAAAALVNFSENATKEVLEPYLDGLLTNLLILLQSPQRFVQEQVLTTIAIIADAAEKKFIKYYDTLMPLLFNVLRTDMGTENRLLKAKCIECSTLIALAVGKEKFAPHCQELIQLFGHIQESAVEDDDPVKPYLEQGWSRICRIIESDFLPYLSGVLPPLLDAANATQDIQVLEEDEAEEYDQNEEWDVIPLSGKHIGVHTAVLDDKSSAIDLLRTYASVLKGDFYPYVSKIIRDIALPAIDFYLHDGVRGSAAMALPALLRSSVFATGNTSGETLELWGLISDKLFDALTNEPVTELLVAYYNAIVDCINLIGAGSLTAPQLDGLVSALDTNLRDTFGRIKARDDEDDEYTEDVEDSEDEFTDEELVDEINKVITAVFKSSKSAFLPHFQKLAPTVLSFINDDSTTIKVCGLCIVSDLIEYTGNDSAAFKSGFLGQLGEAITNPEPAVRQAAIYGIGQAAQQAAASYGEFLLAALEPLFKVITSADARSDDNVSATENGVAAVAKILRSLGSAVPNFDALLDNWVKTLPIVQDDEAAPFAYVFLSELMNSRHSAVTSQIPKTVDSVIQALVHASIAGNTAEKVVSATKELLGALPQVDAMGLLKSYPAETQVVIQQWFA